MPLASFLRTHEPVVRLGCFAGVLLVMAVWEARAATRACRIAKSTRWMHILGLVVLDTFLVRLLFPVAAVGAGLLAAEHGWGLLHQVDWHPAANAVVAFVALDLVVWATHVGMHVVPVLWRVHRVHHADLDYDAATGIRFHPIEILLAMVIKIGAVLALGAPVATIIIFEIVLSASALFNHGNVRLPKPLDRVVRWLVVTPDMHRVHHSTDRREHNRNFGFFLSIWDRLFRVYVDQPAQPHESMDIGLVTQRDPELVVKLWGMVRLPFVSNKAPKQDS